MSIITRDEANACINLIEHPVPRGLSLTKINSKKNADFYVNTGGKYILHLKQTNRYVFVECTGKGVLAADMKILFLVKDGKRDETDATYTVSYNYENYNKIYYDSFKVREDCDTYYLQNSDAKL
jgi:hypothetical protein